MGERDDDAGQEQTSSQRCYESIGSIYAPEKKGRRYHAMNSSEPLVCRREGKIRPPVMPTGER